MNKEFTQICREILALGDMIKNSGLSDSILEGAVEEVRRIKAQIEGIRDQILSHAGGSGGNNEESLSEIRNELNLKLSIAAAEALYATKTEIPNVDGLLSNENAETAYLKIDAANTKFATKEELAAASLGGGDNSAAIEHLQNSIDAKLGKSEAEGIYAKISQLPNLSEYALKTELPDTQGLLSEQAAEELYLKKTDKPNTDNLATKAELENYAKKEQIPDVSGFITQAQGDLRYEIKGQSGGAGGNIDTDTFLQKSEAENIYAKKTTVELLESGKLGKSEKAVDSALFNGNSDTAFVKHSEASETATNLSIVKRTADGSVVATNLSVSGNIILADTESQDGAMTPSSHVIFSEADGKALKRASVNKLKGLITPDLSGYLTLGAADGIYAKKSEIPNLSGYMLTSDAQGMFAYKTQIPDMSGYITSTQLNQRLISISAAINDRITQSAADARYELKGQGGLTAQINKSENGYIKLSNGLILQWGVTAKFGSYSGYQNSDKKTLFPIAFPNTLFQASFTVMSNLENSANSTSNSSFSVAVGRWDKTGMFLLVGNSFPSTNDISDYYNNKLKIKYIAIGH